MGIQAYVEVSAENVASAMIDDAEFAMDVLANLASRPDECAFHEGDSGSSFHSAVANFLDAIARDLRAVRPDQERDVK